MLKRKQIVNKENENSSSPAAKQPKKAPTKKSILTENKENEIDQTTAEPRPAKAIAIPGPIPSSDVILIDSEVNDTSSEPTVDSLKQILKQTQFATYDIVSGAAAELPAYLGLSVKEVGPISLPLSDNQALDLIKVASRDKAKQNNVYRFKASQIVIKNPDWSRQLDTLAKRAATQLGCSNETVHVRLDQLCLYKSGASLPRSTLKSSVDKNMFARLVIQLPCVYTGGECLVYDNSGQKKKADLGQKSKKAAYAIHFAAHMCDATTFEMTEIKSGHCLVLAYDLWTGDNFRRLAKKDEAINSLAEDFKSLVKFEKPIALLLEHQYTHKSLEGQLTERALKGMDKDRYKLLQAANLKLNDTDQMRFYVVRADLEFQELGEKYDFTDRIKELKKKKAAMSSREEEEIEDGSCTKQNLCVCKSRTVRGWCDEQGVFLFENDRMPWARANSESTASLDFFSNIIDLTSETSGNTIQSWTFNDAECGERAGWDGYFFTVSYARYMLMLWPKKHEADELKGIIIEAKSEFENLVH